MGSHLETPGQHYGDLNVRGKGRGMMLRLCIRYCAIANELVR